MVNKYVINGYKWFEKTNGNTYHTVTIDSVKDNKRVFESKHMCYGYGEQWKQTAYDELVKLKLVKKEDRHNYDLNRKRFMWYEHEVSRKKDLFDN